MARPIKYPDRIIASFSPQQFTWLTGEAHRQDRSMAYILRMLVSAAMYMTEETKK